MAFIADLLSPPGRDWPAFFAYSQYCPRKDRAFLRRNGQVLYSRENPLYQAMMTVFLTVVGIITATRSISTSNKALEESRRS